MFEKNNTIKFFAEFIGISLGGFTLSQIAAGINVLIQIAIGLVTLYYLIKKGRKEFKK